MKKKAGTMAVLAAAAAGYMAGEYDLEDASAASRRTRVTAKADITGQEALDLDRIATRIVCADKDFEIDPCNTAAVKASQVRVTFRLGDGVWKANAAKFNRR